MKRKPISLTPEQEIRTIAADLRSASDLGTFITKCAKHSRKLQARQLDVLSIGSPDDVAKFYAFEHLVARVKAKIYQEQFADMQLQNDSPAVKAKQSFHCFGEPMTPEELQAYDLLISIAERAGSARVYAIYSRVCHTSGGQIAYALQEH